MRETETRILRGYSQERLRGRGGLWRNGHESISLGKAVSRPGKHLRTRFFDRLIVLADL